MRQRGGEFGTTTGRPRRTGWLDLVALRYAARLNTMTALVVTKLDVLSGLDRIQVVHELPRRRRRGCSRTSPTTRRCSTTPTAELTELPGWKEDLGECRTLVRPARRGARVPRLHRRAHRRPGRPGRRRPGPRAGHLDRRRTPEHHRRRRPGGLRTRSRLTAGARSRPRRCDGRQQQQGPSRRCRGGSGPARRTQRPALLPAGGRTCFSAAASRSSATPRSIASSITSRSGTASGSATTPKKAPPS